MIESNNQLTIIRPVAEVYAFLMNIANYPRWQAGLLSLEATDGMKAGSRLTFCITGLGRQFNLSANVTTNDGHSSFTAINQRGPITFTSTYRLSAVDENTTRLTVTNLISAKNVFQLAETALQSINDARNLSDLQTLKQLLDNHADLAEDINGTSSHQSNRNKRHERLNKH